ncbi:DMT family transporter [Wenzhouxiangella limi]|uniref:DMT family transporter n=1 Tax=Wenzhouxiangella limi TaxID=2707351 RepID=A0A845V2W9_9GAMM|nr:DMT family transporter [Wenzhouxiangella limi]NDY94345.1 DMT family transporter [Wenzhouxiangella limi]
MSISAAFVLLAAFFWGLSGGIGGVLISDGWDPLVVSFYRGTIGLVFVGAWLALHPQDNGLKDPWLWFWSVLAGIGIAGNFTFYFMSIDHGSIAVAATLMYTAPVFVYLISFALKLEPPTLLKWIAVALVTAGIVLLTEVYDIDGGSVTRVAVGAGLLAALSYTLFIFGLKRAALHGSPQATLSIAFAILAVLLAWPADNSQLLTALTTSDWPLFVALGVLGAGLSFVFYVVGLKNTAPAIAAVVAMVEPVTASLFSVVVLTERLTLLQTFGMALILLTVTALSVHSSNGKQASE